MIDLIKLALSGKYTPMDFCIAMRHVPSYDPSRAIHLEEQIFDSNGQPVKEK